MAHTAELLAVGTELLLGSIVNSDARDLSRLLSGMGIGVYYHTVVGDNPERLRKVLAIARERADIVITTGGLGPTCDDLTKQILAKSFGLELEMHEDEKLRLYDYLTNRGYSREMTENNLKQAMLPVGCTVFHNDWGTAPLLRAISMQSARRCGLSPTTVWYLTFIPSSESMRDISLASVLVVWPSSISVPTESISTLYAFFNFSRLPLFFQFRHTPLQQARRYPARTLSARRRAAWAWFWGAWA